jgi:3D (Asp-Asp-Asp) domain-containing protein
MQTLLNTALTGLFLLTGTGVANSASIASSAPATAPESYSVSMTAYNAVASQTDDDPLETASGAYSDPVIVAARSVDLADELPYGTVIDVEPSATSSPSCGLPLVQGLVGLRVIADSMNARMRNKVDILLPNDATVSLHGEEVSAARVLGLCKDITVRVVGHIDTSNMPKSQAQLAQMIGGRSLAIRN